MNAQDIADWTGDIKATAHAMVREASNGAVDTTQGVWGDPSHTPHGPMHAIVLTLEMGPGEADCLLVVGFVNPHDANLTVVINHMDGTLIHDNAEDMFPR